MVYRFVGRFSKLSKTALSDFEDVDGNVFKVVADLHYKSQCILQELRTKRDGSPVAAAEHDLINQKICDICVAKQINIVFEKLATEAQELATWAEHNRQESSGYFKHIRDISIEEIDETRPATYLRQGPYGAPEHVRKATRLR